MSTPSRAPDAMLSGMLQARQLHTPAAIEGNNHDCALNALWFAGEHNPPGFPSGRYSRSSATSEKSRARAS